MHDIFNIATGFYGTLISAYARLNIDRVVDEVNNDTLDPWADLQTKAGISQTTPLSPFMEKELLKDMDLSMDGSAFEKETGFQSVYTYRNAYMDDTNLVLGTNIRNSQRPRSRK